MNQSENIIIRVSPELKFALAEIAKVQDRSLSKVIKHILEAAISPAPASAPAPAKVKAKAKAKVVTYRKTAKAKAKAKK